MKASSLQWFRLLLASLAIITAWLALQTPWGQRLNLSLLDLYTRWQAVDEAPADIVIVDIDDASLQRVAPWPWPRARMAELIERLYREHRLRGMALDMVFPEGKLRADDLRLARTIARHGVCIAHAFDTGAAGRAIGHLAAPTALPIVHPLQASGYVGNYSLLAQEASCSGHITPQADFDGVVRRMPAGFRHGSQTWPWLAGALTARLDQSAVQRRYLPIPYRHRLRSWRAVPAHAVLSGELPPHALDGAWVLVGSTALGLNDAVVTPLNAWTPGVVLHAELLDARLHPLPPPLPGLPLWPWGVAVAILAWTLWAVRRERLLWGGVGLLTINLVWLAVAAALWRARVDFAVAAPLLTTWLALLLLLPFEWRWVLRRHWRLARRSKRP